ncbi:MAG TPA: hypothetical protein VIM71_10140 [Lacunisphaera sp.]
MKMSSPRLPIVFLVLSLIFVLLAVLFAIRISAPPPEERALRQIVRASDDKESVASLREIAAKALEASAERKRTSAERPNWALRFFSAAVLLEVSALLLVVFRKNEANQVPEPTSRLTPGRGTS